MTATSPKAFLLSASLHGAVIAMLLLFGYVVNQQTTETPKVFELVAGEGDNYMAKEAPALGIPGGVKIDIPKAPDPVPAPIEPAPQPVAPVAPAPLPTPKPVTPALTKQEPPVPNFKKQLQGVVTRADAKAKREVKKEREAEAKKAAEDAKRMTKEEFDRANKSKTTAAAAAAAKGAPTKVAKIDAEGIAKGVVGGSTANKVGGAGGKALKTDHDDVLAAYDALFKQRLRREFEPPPGLSDSLKVTIELRSNPDGSLVNPRVVTPSGSPEFDRAVLEAIRRVRMPARPDRKSEVIEFIFTMRERNDG